MNPDKKSAKYQFTFEDYRIVNLIFNTNEKFKPGKKPIQLNPRLDITHENKKKNLSVRFTLELGDTDTPFHILIEARGSFQFDHDVSEMDLEPVVNVNCAAIMYPFIRETMADVTRRGGFDPLLLPPINFVNAYKRGKQAEQPGRLG